VVGEMRRYFGTQASLYAKTTCQNFCVQESRPGQRMYSILSAIARALFWHSCTAKPNVNLSHYWQFLPCASGPHNMYFQPVGIGKVNATGQCRRSGAQRGVLEDKLRPEVFLDAPCISLHPRFQLADGSPPQAAGCKPNSSQYQLLLDVQSRLPQQSRNHRLFEA